MWRQSFKIVIPQGQNIHLRRSLDQRRRFDSYRRQPRAQQLNPAWAAEARSDDDPNAPLRLASTPTPPPQARTFNPAPHITGP